MDSIMRRMVSATTCDGCKGALAHGADAYRAGLVYCAPCAGERRPGWEAEHKAALAARRAARKRCEVPGCARAGTRLMARVLTVCGAHCKAIQAARTASLSTGGMLDIIGALASPTPNRAQLLALAGARVPQDDAAGHTDGCPCCWS